MKLSQKILFFMDYFSMGLIAPVLSLVALSHGATIETLSLFLGLFAEIVIVFEVPSGMIADLAGRKKCFILAHVCALINYVIIMMSHGPTTLIVAYIFKGLGRAFGSGSLEALTVEECIRQKGEDSISEVNSQLLWISGIAMATGALCGGVIGNIGSDYMVLLIVLAVLEGIIVICSALLIKEKREKTVGNSFYDNIKNHICLMYGAMKTSGTVVQILLVASLMASSLLVVEVYWQQNLIKIISTDMMWILGIVSCLGYFGASFGSKIGEKMLQKENRERLYWLLRILYAVAVLILGLCAKWYIFILLYAVAYMILGKGDLFEKSLLHENIENRYRASMLSLYSLFIRGGGMVASVLASGIVVYGGLSLVWFVIPSVAIALMVVIKFTYSK